MKEVDNPSELTVLPVPSISLAPFSVVFDLHRPG
jgi:hypothetical protein